ncbi:MAG: hypothetical protein KDB03_15625 [Planctomycetales bacterium]|nr:hypothetical protein [Planctomycetales bacterium]
MSTVSDACCYIDQLCLAAQAPCNNGTETTCNDYVSWYGHTAPFLARCYEDPTTIFDCDEFWPATHSYCGFTYTCHWTAGVGCLTDGSQVNHDVPDECQDLCSNTPF